MTYSNAMSSNTNARDALDKIVNVQNSFSENEEVFDLADPNDNM